MSDARVPRRRRSVARSPALVDPADLPEDAPGRVALIAVRAPDDKVDETAAVGVARPVTQPAAAVATHGTALERFLTAFDGWLAVAALAALLLVIFVVGMAFTR